MYYNNYHKHSHYSNIKTLDVVVKVEDYLQRMVELGHRNYFTTEHGYQGYPFEVLTLIDDWNKRLPDDKRLKMVVGTEAYFVEDVSLKHRGYHLVIIALNNKGVEGINELLTEANVRGVYYKPRVDFEMIEKFLDPSSVIITSACVAGIGAKWYENSFNTIKWFKDRFKDNFYLEIQSHNHPVQIEHNKKMKELSRELQIQLIHANDSHYIKPEDSYYRDMFLKGKDMIKDIDKNDDNEYKAEMDFILDYPEYNEILTRYQQQGVFNNSEAMKALENTRVFDRCEEITIYNDDIKIPKISENPLQELKNILNEEWKRKKEKVPKERYIEYLESIRKETKIIEDTNMASYFVLDYEICKHAREKYNAFISPTGRGSGGSFYVNMLLGLTELDRHISPVTLYPTRFMSTERILSSRSLPDIDINCSNQEDLVKASEDILGKEYCGWMVSFKPLKESSAFRLWCKAKGLEQSEYNEFAKHIRECVEKGDYSYKDDSKWKDLVKESEIFVGVIESISPSPCSILLSTEPVAEHIGYIKINDKICCNLDGYNCDKYKYLKNDYLNVTVYKIVQDTCKLAGIDIPNIEQLTSLLDDKVWNIYEKGLTCTINQADSNYATPLIMRYKPKSVEEVCAFVAAIRPGFASLLQNFLDRKTYSTGVKELDNLLEDSFHYMLYQESIMKYLIWLGMDESETYTIIKKISKKKFKEEELSELKRKLQIGWRKKVGRDEGFEETWKVVEDASHYSFNASHSLAYAYDSIYGAYLKSHYPLEYYSATFNLYEDDLERTPKLVSELDYFGIKLEKARFGYSKSKYFFDRGSNTIYKGIKSIKYMNEDIGNFLYDIKDDVKDFLDFLIKSKGILDKRQIEILIKLDFFREFGEINYLLKIYDIYKKYSEVKQLKKEILDIPIEVARKYCEKETSKLLKEVDNIGLINELIKTINCAEVTTKEKLEDEFEFTGGILPQKDTDIQFCMISDVKEFNTLRVDFIHVRTGERYSVKAKKYFSKQIEKGKVVKITEFEKKPKPVLVDGKWANSKSETELWIKSIEKID